MLNFAANLSFLYQELPFLERFNAAASDGFKGVEYLFPYDWSPDEIMGVLKRTGLQQVLFNLSPGDWTNGERGLASVPNKGSDFLETVRQALDYASLLNCPRLHVMAGLRDRSISFEHQQQIFIESLVKALELSAPYNITLLIEPINPEDMPGYFLNDFQIAKHIISEINQVRLKLQFDIYHCQKIHGNLSQNLSDLLEITGHIQIANPPNRSEPDNGEIDYSYLFKSLREKQYNGWIGCEYKPSRSTRETLAWASGYLKQSDAHLDK